MQAFYMRRGKQRRSRQRSWLRYGVWALAGVLTLFVLGNAAMWFAYRGRVLPNVSLAAEPVGNTPYGDIDKKVDASKLLPEAIALTKGEQSHEVSTQELGLGIDWPATQEQLKRQRTWLPLLNLFAHRIVPTELTVDRQAFDAALANIKSTFTKQPLPERVTFNGSAFVVVQPEDGTSSIQTNLSQSS